MTAATLEKLGGLYQQKAISLLLFLPLVWFLNPEKVLLLYIIFGHAHFGLTYWYQFKGGRFKFAPLTIVSYIAILLGLFWCAYHKPIWLLMFSSLFFVIHYYLDEFKINQERLTLPRFVLLVPFLALLVVSLNLHEHIVSQYYFMMSSMRESLTTWDAYLGHTPDALGYLATVSGKTALQGYWPWLGGALAAAIGAYGVQSYRAKQLNIAALYVLLITIAAFALIWTHSIRHVTSVFGFIILSHYTHWYVSVFQKLRRFAPEKLSTYFAEIAIANAIVIGLWAYTYFLPQAPLAWSIDRWGYNFHAFMVWTSMHLITTVRARDYKDLFGKLGEKAALSVQAVTRFR